jgi:hypothetical protein
MNKKAIERVTSRTATVRYALTSLMLVFLFSSACPSGVVRAGSVSDWNVVAINTARAAGKNAVLQSRIYAMTHAAIHDALNAIDRRYQPYALNIQSDPASSPLAAVAAAAYAVLLHELPSQQSALDMAYANALAAIPDGAEKTSGIAVGQAAAAAILALRSSDGSLTAQFPHLPGMGPGVWQPTPPAFVPGVLPGWGNVVPFALVTSNQFLPDEPALFNLLGPKFTDAYNEVKSVGSLNSTTRSTEQSEIARFWYEDSPPGWNRIAGVVVAQRGLNLWEIGRLFALLNFAIADAYIAGFNAKYSYNFWRPVTAIRAGDMDGNADTIGDPAWNPFLVTPPTPDYTSTHSVTGAAAAEVLARFFDDDEVNFSMTSGPPFGGITRSFVSFSHAAQENADSRVYAGIHFRASCSDGLKQGRKIGKFTFQHHLRSVR